MAGTPDYETLAGERSVIEAVIPEAMTATGPGVSCSAGAAPSRRARSTEAVSAAQPMFYTLIRSWFGSTADRIHGA